jgi:hypothetical protein
MKFIALILFWSLNLWAYEQDSLKLKLLAENGLIDKEDYLYHRNRFNASPKVKKIQREIASIDPDLKNNPVIKRTNSPILFKLD